MRLQRLSLRRRLSCVLVFYLVLALLLEPCWALAPKSATRGTLPDDWNTATAGLEAADTSIREAKTPQEISAVIDFLIHAGAEDHEIASLNKKLLQSKPFLKGYKVFVAKNPSDRMIEGVIVVETNYSLRTLENLFGFYLQYPEPVGYVSMVKAQMPTDKGKENVEARLLATAENYLRGIRHATVVTSLMDYERVPFMNAQGFEEDPLAPVIFAKNLSTSAPATLVSPEVLEKDVVSSEQEGPKPVEKPAKDFRKILKSWEGMKDALKGLIQEEHLIASSEEQQIMEFYLLVFLLRGKKTNEWRDAALDYLILKNQIGPGVKKKVLASLEWHPPEALQLLATLETSVSLSKLQTLYGHWLRKLLNESEFNESLRWEGNLALNGEVMHVADRGIEIPLPVFLAIPPEEWPKRLDKFLSDDDAFVRRAHASPEALHAARKDVQRALSAPYRTLGPMAKLSQSQYSNFFAYLDREEIWSNLDVQPKDTVVLSPNRDVNNLFPFRPESLRSILLMGYMGKYHRSGLRLKMVRAMVDIDKALQIGGRLDVIDDGNTPLATYELLSALGYRLVGKKEIRGINSWDNYLSLSFVKTHSHRETKSRIQRFDSMVLTNFIRPSYGDIDEMERRRDFVREGLRSIPSPQGQPPIPREKFNTLPETLMSQVKRSLQRKGMSEVFCDLYLVLLRRLEYLGRVDLQQKTMLGHERIPLILDKAAQFAGLSPLHCETLHESILYHDTLHLLLQELKIEKGKLLDRFFAQFKAHGLDVDETLRFFATEYRYVPYREENGRRIIRPADHEKFLKSKTPSVMAEEIFLDALVCHWRPSYFHAQKRLRKLLPLVKSALMRTEISRDVWPASMGRKPANLWNLFEVKRRKAKPSVKEIRAKRDYLGLLLQKFNGRRHLHPERVEEIAFLEKMLDGLIATAKFTSRTAVNMHGDPVHYKIGGNPNAQKTLFLVHGWTGDLHHWIMQIPNFEKEYRIILMDLPGHGGTPLRGPPENLVTEIGPRNMLAVLEQEGILEHVIPVGHSMGGMVIQQLMKSIYLTPRKQAVKQFLPGGRFEMKPFGAYRKTFESIVLIDSTPVAPIRTSGSSRLEGWVARYLRWLPHIAKRFQQFKEYLLDIKARPDEFSVLERWVNRRIFTGKKRVVFDFMLPISMEPGEGLENAVDEEIPYEKLAHAWEGMNRHDAHEMLDKIKIPVLVVHGEQDTFLDFAKVRRWYDRIDPALLEYFVVPGQRHMPHFEDPDTVNPVLASFFARSGLKRTKFLSTKGLWRRSPILRGLLYLYQQFIKPRFRWLYEKPTPDRARVQSVGIGSETVIGVSL